MPLLRLAGMRREDHLGCSASRWDSFERARRAMLAAWRIALDDLIIEREVREVCEAEIAATESAMRGLLRLREASQ